MYRDSRLKSILKTLSWRFTATVTTIVLVFIFTKNIKISASIGGIEIFVKLLLYYLHERAWGRINLGKRFIEGQPRTVGEWIG